MDKMYFANGSCERSKLVLSTVESLKIKAEKLRGVSESKACGKSLQLAKITTKIIFLLRIVTLEISFKNRGNVVKEALSGKERFEDGQFVEAMNSMINEKLDLAFRKIILNESPNEYISGVIAELDSILNLINWYGSKK